ncbi:hypothetical protein K6W36_18870, partial [Acetobacter senegalensis]|uniref:phosphopantetheine-binding protein n=1 Tax=Acetobacter senegalensis TaxID=446692 RepID=UPI001EDBABBA
SMETLPLTVNGKLDRRALPEPELGSAEREIVEARTPAEAALLAVWREVFGHDNIGVTDNFFEVGGDSILAIRLFSRIKVLHNQNIVFADFFNNASVIGVMDILEKNKITHSSIENDINEILTEISKI